MRSSEFHQRINGKEGHIAHDDNLLAGRVKALDGSRQRPPEKGVGRIRGEYLPIMRGTGIDPALLGIERPHANKEDHAHVSIVAKQLQGLAVELDALARIQRCLGIVGGGAGQRRA